MMLTEKKHAYNCAGEDDENRHWIQKKQAKRKVII